jgi:hypothetical protein
MAPSGSPPRSHHRRATLCVVVALLLAASAGVGADARAAGSPEIPGGPVVAPFAGLLPPADPASLREALTMLPKGCRLRAYLVRGFVVDGRLAEVRDDTLWLRPGNRTGLWPAPLADLVRLERNRAASETGAGIGAALGGLLGALAGAGLASLGASMEAGDNDDGAVFGGLAFGLMGGAVFGGLVGGGLGALGSEWQIVDPERLRAERRAEPPPPVPRPTTGRLLFEAGWSRGDGGGYRDDGAMLAIGLLTRRGPWCELGPVLRCHAIDGMPEQPGPRHEPSGVQPAGSFLLETRVQPAAAGWQPWLEAGAGVVLTDDLHPGGHLGAGLRHRDAHDRDWHLAARRTFVVGGGTGLDIDGIWTLAAGVTFRP